MGLAHPVDLGRRNVQRLVPGQLDEVVDRRAPTLPPSSQPRRIEGRATRLR
jgi:hypothetical protein